MCAYAWSATAILSSNVLDASGAAISSANLRAVNGATAAERKVVADSEGSFSVPSLPPGKDSLKSERDSFAPYEFRGIALNVSGHQHLEMRLKVGAAQESITVQSNFALQTESMELAGLVSERRIRELPLNGRDLNNLISLMPGAFGTPTSSNGSPSIGGARTTATNYTIDGFAADDERVDGPAPGGGFNSLGNYTNALHGSAYEDLRNDAFDARDFFNTSPFLNRDRSLWPIALRGSPWDLWVCCCPGRWWLHSPGSLGNCGGRCG